MTTAASEANAAIGKAKGRKGADKQEAVIKTGPIKDAIEDGVAIFTKMGLAQDAFNDWVKAVAEKSGMLAANVRKFVVARATDKIEEGKRNAEQLSILFEEVGDKK